MRPAVTASQRNCHGSATSAVVCGPQSFPRGGRVGGKQSASAVAESTGAAMGRATAAPAGGGGQRGHAAPRPGATECAGCSELLGCLDAEPNCQLDCCSRSRSNNVPYRETVQHIEPQL